MGGGGGGGGWEEDVLKWRVELDIESNCYELIDL